MHAAVYHGPGDLRVEERALPRLAADDALLRVIGCGVCGTDRRIVSGGHRHYPPGTERVPGHELVGEIVEAGAAVRDEVPVGAMVFVAPNMGCGRCRQCLSGSNNLCLDFAALGITLDGGFAEYVRIPAQAIAQGNVISLRAGTDPAVATLIEPLACVVRGQEHLAIDPGSAVLVIGAGPIGILHVMLARLKGAGRVIVADPWVSRLGLAGRLGADVGVNVRTEDLAAIVARETGGGADAVIVAAPSPEAMVAALDHAAVGGRIAYFAGLPKDRSTIAVDANRVHYKELRVSGTTACSTLDCLFAADIVNSGRLALEPLVTGRIALAELPDAVTQGGDRAVMKTVVMP